MLDSQLVYFVHTHFLSKSKTSLLKQIEPSAQVAAVVNLH